MKKRKTDMVKLGRWHFVEGVSMTVSHPWFEPDNILGIIMVCEVMATFPSGVGIQVFYINKHIWDLCLYLIK